MPDAVDFHDYTIETLLVDAKTRRLVLRAFDAHAASGPSLVAEFNGLVGYCLVGDVLGTIIFELEERAPFETYKKFAPHLQAAYASSGGHGHWVASDAEAQAFLTANAIRGFELDSSIGATGAVWCREFRNWVEANGPA
jgi:hypothetical protein